MYIYIPLICSSPILIVPHHSILFYPFITKSLFQSFSAKRAELKSIANNTELNNEERMLARKKLDKFRGENIGIVFQQYHFINSLYYAYLLDVIINVN